MLVHMLNHLKSMLDTGSLNRRRPVDDVLRWLAYKDMTNYQEVANVVNEYYRNPKPLIEKARRELSALRLEKPDLKL